MWCKKFLYAFSSWKLQEARNPSSTTEPIFTSKAWQLWQLWQFSAPTPTSLSLEVTYNIYKYIYNKLNIIITIWKQPEFIYPSPENCHNCHNCHNCNAPLLLLLLSSFIHLCKEITYPSPSPRPISLRRLSGLFSANLRRIDNKSPKNLHEREIFHIFAKEKKKKKKRYGTRKQQNTITPRRNQARIRCFMRWGSCKKARGTIYWNIRKNEKGWFNQQVHSAPLRYAPHRKSRVSYRRCHWVSN